VLVNAAPSTGHHSAGPPVELRTDSLGFFDRLIACAQAVSVAKASGAALGWSFDGRRAPHADMDPPAAAIPAVRPRHNHMRQASRPLYHKTPMAWAVDTRCLHTAPRIAMWPLAWRTAWRKPASLAPTALHPRGVGPAAGSGTYPSASGSRICRCMVALGCPAQKFRCLAQRVTEADVAEVSALVKMWMARSARTACR
jgi:hypothetical protein